MTTGNWILNAAQKLRRVGITSSRLDVELILARRLDKSREWLLAHNDFELNEVVLKQAQDDIVRRLNHEPLAYILGKKEFYGRTFMVTPDVLIPRPESEQIIEQLELICHPEFISGSSICRGQILKRVQDDEVGVLDIGTGSGALAITAALEFPFTQVTASDISDAALKITQQNAKKLGARVTFVKSDLLDNIDEEFDIIIANLPYVDRNWHAEIESPEISHEPETALFTDDGGLKLIKKLIQQAPAHLSQNGHLILEMDPCQIETIKEFATGHGFITISEWPFGVTLQKVDPETILKQVQHRVQDDGRIEIEIF
jgi:release factor glutamine methyltransferase